MELQEQMEQNNPDEPIAVYIILLSFPSLICHPSHPHFPGTTVIFKTVNVSTSIKFTEINNLLEVDHIAKILTILQGTVIYAGVLPKKSTYLKFLHEKEVTHTYVNSYLKSLVVFINIKVDVKQSVFISAKMHGKRLRGRGFMLNFWVRHNL